VKKRSEPEEKSEWLPKIRIEPSRREAYDAAVEARRVAGERDLTLTQWVRETLDAEARGR
jgi:hypothetical protein